MYSVWHVDECQTLYMPNHECQTLYMPNHMDEFSVLHKSARLPDGTERVRAAVGKVNEYPILIRIHRLYTLHNYGFRTGGAASG